MIINLPSNSNVHCVPFPSFLQMVKIFNSRPYYRSVFRFLLLVSVALASTEIRMKLAAEPL